MLMAEVVWRGMLDDAGWDMLGLPGFDIGSQVPE